MEYGASLRASAPLAQLPLGAELLLGETESRQAEGLNDPEAEAGSPGLVIGTCFIHAQPQGPGTSCFFTETGKISNKKGREEFPFLS